MRGPGIGGKLAQVQVEGREGVHSALHGIVIESRTGREFSPRFQLAPRANPGDPSRGLLWQRGLSHERGALDGIKRAREPKGTRILRTPREEPRYSERRELE